MITKQCSDCGFVFEATSKFFFRDPDCTFGLKPVCKACCSLRKKEYRKAHPELIKKQEQEMSLRRALKKLNLTKEWYEAKVEEQREVCEICNNKCKVFFRLSIDHNHKTNRPRGLLCAKCNVAVGNIKEDIRVAQSLVRYLEKYQ